MCFITNTGNKGKVLENRKIGKDNVSLFKHGSNSKKFNSDLKELTFCISNTSWFLVCFIVLELEVGLGN